jgi:hypothetical protein
MLWSAAGQVLIFEDRKFLADTLRGTLEKYSGMFLL